MIDLATARETFEASQDLTVGIEEEYALVHPETLELIPKFEELRDAGADDPVLADAIAGELISSEIEIRSGRGEDVADARAKQQEARRRLFALAEEHDVRLGTTGTHPLSDYREQHIIDTPHYHRVEDGLKYVAWRNNTFALQVHVGVQGADRAVKVCDRLRPVLPLLLAISANSPYVDRIDSGPAHRAHARPSPSRSRAAASRTRSAAGTRGPSTSTCSCAPARSSSSRSSGGRSGRTTRSAPSRCGSATPRPPRAEADALAELMVACVAQALREIDAGETPPDLPHRLIEENMWRAIRYGQDGRLLDLEAAADRGVPRRRGARPPQGLDGRRHRRCPSSTARSASGA